MVVLGQVGVQARAQAARQRGGFPHQIAADAERRAGRGCHIDHGTVPAVVPGLDHALRVFEDQVLALHQGIGRQAALRLAHAHAAARGHKTHANRLRGFDAVVQPHAVWVQIKMIAAGGAAAQQQLGHRHPAADLHHLGRQAGPDRVQGAQPAKQLGVLRLRNGPRQALVHVVVGIHQTRQHQVAARVNHLVGSGRQLSGRANGFDAMVPYEDRGLAQFARLGWVRVVKGGHAIGVADEQGGHGEGSQWRLETRR